MARSGSRKGKYQLFDALRPEEYAALEKDILARGVQVAVEVDEDGVTLDGHHRVEIADRHGLKYKTVTRKFKTEQEKREHVIKLNLARRHFEPWQWGQAFKLLLEERGVKRGSGKGNPAAKKHKAATVAALVKELGVPDRTARQHMKAADDVEALPAKLKRDVKQGKTTLNKAKAEVRKKKTAAKEAKAAAKVTAKEKPWKVTDKQQMVTCDALLTDPPYGILDQPWEPKEIETFTRQWAKTWAKCGADFIATFWSQQYLWEGRTWFDEMLEGYSFQQLLVWCCPNNKSPQSRRGFKQSWEPILFYRHNDSDKEVTIGGNNWGEELTDFDHHVAAVPQGNFNDQNMKQHPAQKPVSVMLWLTNALTSPGELVCDPFCGSGTTGIAAMQLGRRFHGIETDPMYMKLSKQRIAAYGICKPSDGAV